MLYDLRQDPAETTNLAHRPGQQGRLAGMLRRLAELAEESVEPMQPLDPPWQGPDYECADCPRRNASNGVGDPWTPWLT